jgi:hypothetical protein
MIEVDDAGQFALKDLGLLDAPDDGLAESVYDRSLGLVYHDYLLA